MNLDTVDVAQGDNEEVHQTEMFAFAIFFLWQLKKLLLWNECREKTGVLFSPYIYQSLYIKYVKP